MIAIHRFFALDSQSVSSIRDMLHSTKPDCIEIMPGIACKVIQEFASGKTPVIAGGLIEEKKELTAALGCGAVAVSTGKKELWYL
jgi:glycerol uptake operon antiterminator